MSGRAAYLAHRLVLRLEQFLLRQVMRGRDMHSIADYPRRDSATRVLFRDYVLEIDQFDGKVFVWKRSYDGEFYLHEVYRD